MGGRLPTILTFVLPYKRFASPDLLTRAKAYLNESRATYRSVVRHNRCLIGYPLEGQDANTQSTNNQDVDSQVSPGTHQPVVPPSLVWRFITWMGSLTFSLDKAREMILKHQPNSLVPAVAWRAVWPGLRRALGRLSGAAARSDPSRHECFSRSSCEQ